MRARVLALVVCAMALGTTSNARNASSRALDVTMPASARAPVRLTANGADQFWIELAPLDVGVDVELAHATTSDGRYEDFRVLRSPRANPTQRWKIKRGSGVARLDVVEGRVEAIDARGVVRIASSPAFAIDARGVRRDVALSIVHRADDDVLVATLDTRGLAYPIAIDPAWSAGGSMTTARSSHTITAVDGGALLVVGGSSGGASLSSAEVYDATHDRFRKVSSMAHARRGHTATSLPSGEVLVVGGEDDTGALATAETYDPKGDRWTSVGSMSVPRRHHTATRLGDGTVLVVGGDAEGVAYSSAELFDPTTGAFHPVTSASAQRAFHSATLLTTGSVLVAGGEGATAKQTGESYDPKSDRWTPTAPLLFARKSHTGTLLGDGRVLIVGGEGGALSRPINEGELYDPLKNAWTRAAPMIRRRSAHTATLLPTGKLLVVGGDGDNDTTAVTLNGSAELYDENRNAWAFAGWLEITRSAHVAAPLASGTRLVIAGGTTRDGRDLDTAELFEPVVEGACTGSAECTSGFCADGFCCDAPCDGTCVACSASKKGGGADGKCGPVVEGSDPDRECTGPCGGTCDGKGACHGRGAIPTACGALTCVDGKITARDCEAGTICDEGKKACVSIVAPAPSGSSGDDRTLPRGDAPCTCGAIGSGAPAPASFALGLGALILACIGRRRRNR